MKIPDHLKKWPETYSNSDFEHPGEEAEAAIRAGTHFIEHPAWDHHGTIWFSDDKFVELVSIYRVEQLPIYGSSLKEVFDNVNTRHGLG